MGFLSNYEQLSIFYICYTYPLLPAPCMLPISYLSLQLRVTLGGSTKRGERREETREDGREMNEE
jgi:hypothetical protein